VTGLSPEKSRKNSHMLRNLETPQKRAVFEGAPPNELE
jgi:hypothetical protein